MIHAFHDLVAEAAFARKGTQLSGAAWRRTLADPRLTPEARQLLKDAWKETFDNNLTKQIAAGEHEGTFNRPETLNPLLDEVLGGMLKPEYVGQKSFLGGGSQ